MSETEKLFISEFANLQLRHYCLGTKISTYIVDSTSHLIISSTLIFLLRFIPVSFGTELYFN